LVSNPASPTITQEHLPRGHFCLIGCFRCSRVLLGAESRGLKIRVSVVRFRPWPPRISLALHHLQSGCAAEVRWLCRICAVTFRVGGVDRQMFRGEVRITSHHLLGFPTCELLQREERCPALHVPGGPRVAKVVPAELSHTRLDGEGLDRAARAAPYRGPHDERPGIH
jgi:hypothetical protein